MNKIFIILLTLIPFISCRVTSRVSDPGPYFSGVSEEYIFSAGPNEFQTIEIKLPTSEVNKIKVFFSQEFQFKIIAEFWGEDHGQLNEFIAKSLSLKTNEDKSHIYIDLSGSFGNRAVAEGRYAVSGIWLNSLKIAIPGNSQTNILVNGVPLESLVGVQKPAEATHGSESVSSEEIKKLAAALQKLGNDTGRIRVLYNYMSTFDSSFRDRSFEPKRFITMCDVLTILKTFGSSSGSLEACKLFSGRVMDKENALAVVETLSDLGRDSGDVAECYRLLLR